MKHNRNVSQDRWYGASDAIAAAFIRRLQPLGTGVLRYGLVGLLLFWGALKFAQFEAEAIQPLLAHSPLLFWMLAVFDVRTASAIIGVVEIVIGLGILTRRLWPRVSGLASLGASGMFLVTLSFLFSTPSVLDPMSPAFGFLVKDLILLGAALYTAGEALQAPKRVAAPHLARETARHTRED
jgi:uncharacterized membrane protein YkgB